MSFGKMRSFIEIVSVDDIKDNEGFGTQKDTVIASVRAYHEERHGTVRWANMAAFSTATDMFRFRTIPGVEVTAKNYIICGGARYSIESPEDVRSRGMYVEVMAKKVEAANG